MSTDLTKESLVGIIGSGAMGVGIAQIAAENGHNVVLYDVDNEALVKARIKIEALMDKLISKGKRTQEQATKILSCIRYVDGLHYFKDTHFVIEAIVENLEVKTELFLHLEKVVGKDCVLATNTSSLSIAAIGGKMQNPERLIGVHFFNPAPLMPLVEIIPSLRTNPEIVEEVTDLVKFWGKHTVLAKDTPGFIVNRVARPFYSEALRILEEGIADVTTIDWAMKDLAGFRMGPFELMDLIGNDINYVVTETVWQQMYYDPKYKPAITQKRLMESGLHGRKTGIGFYDYEQPDLNPLPFHDRKLGQEIVDRILYMLINEAADTLFWKIASRDDIDTAMIKGLNHPKGPFQWADEIGILRALDGMRDLFEWYGDDRYRPSILLKRKAEEAFPSFY
ncbi:MAG TPA: 3-hydroxybutyryl-CoA dehydrogenase [Flavobacteriales bacterium]|jgi:3-hydroxybutyryl-CoA dehydrogenase|nr:3-hydroxybutyryl-CoA dehydrogenase [Flavobacteriales bacterium]